MYSTRTACSCATHRHISSPAKGWAGPVNFGLGSAANACSASRRSSRVVIFKLIGEPGTIVTAARGVRQAGHRRWRENRRVWHKPPAAIAGEKLAAFGLPKGCRGRRFRRSCDRRRRASAFRHRHGQDGRAAFFGRRENLRDPFVGQARPGRVVNGHEIDVRLHAGQCPLDRIGPLAPLRRRRCPRWRRWRRT